ncbi:MAG TPA: hypothetical protein VGC13_27000 [Longimicrobium sp.]|jgi:hypothetical protein|uniref:hypothetical protein n=1 Tax=Longimicrobium sp. TaxID=2029185 RepID=UPI002EDA41D0
MSRPVELSDEQYERVEEAAATEGITPAEWIARHLPTCPEVQPATNGKPGKTLAERFAGRVGLIDSGGDGRLSEDHSKLFGEYLEEKHRAGRL